ncbi:uncharacterized protein LOC122973010 [Thunnus albacares]|uniref:uncharacterized protein LOC122973010 n=1 Tax=Thunnus albacares TaxID=8236 RepID=UPI001CF60A5C|nr:uncharacterized protein LOC122973010 [Thunnus albacares]
MNSHNVTVKAAYVGDPVTLQAYVADGMEAEFSWWFTHREKEENKGVEEERTSVKTACLPNTDCLNSTMNWTFETEGVHVVSVNASTTSGWTQETIHIVVVRLAVSDLRVSVSGEQLSVGEGISVDVQLLTTMKQLLLLNFTLNSNNNQNDDDRMAPTHIPTLTASSLYTYFTHPTTPAVVCTSTFTAASPPLQDSITSQRLSFPPLILHQCCSSLSCLQP